MLTLNTATLRAALTLCKGAIDTRNTIPILSHVRITSDGEGRVTLTATDMETAYILPLAGSGAAMDVCLPHKQLTGLLASYKAGDVVLKMAAGARVSVQAGGMSSSLASLPTDDFPIMAMGKLPHSFAMPAPRLREAFAVPQHAISTETTRYYLNGVCMDMEQPDVMLTQATDGHRLARVTTPKPAGVGLAGRIIVPARMVTCMLAFLGKSQDTAMVEWSDSRIGITLNGGVLISKTIDGEFPDVGRVIPRDNGIIVTASSAALTETVKRVASVNAARSAPVKLTTGPCRLDVSAHSAENGDAVESVAATAPPGELEIGFQAQYLRDALAWCGSTVEMAFSDGESPAVLRQVGDASRLFVIMSMRV